MTEERMTFRFSETVIVGPIKKSDKYWHYTVVETTYRTITHTRMYHSTNLLALKRHRFELMRSLKERKDRLDRSSYYTGLEIKPTLLERIKAKQNEKIH